MAIKNVQYARHSLILSVYYKTHYGWTRKNFQIKGSQMAGKCYSVIDFCKYSKCLL